MASSPFTRLPAFDPESGTLNVVIDTPKGSRNKFKFDEELGLFKHSGVLPAGAVFPFDFGFVPSTKGGDGDPLDVLVLMDEPAFVGCLVPAGLYLATGEEFWQALAFTGFFLNLFNLLPVVPLDGGRAMAAMAPWMWFVGFGAMVALLFIAPNQILILIRCQCLSLSRYRHHCQSQSHYQSRCRNHCLNHRQSLIHFQNLSHYLFQSQNHHHFHFQIQSLIQNRSQNLSLIQNHFQNQNRFQIQNLHQNLDQNPSLSQNHFQNQSHFQSLWNPIYYHQQVIWMHHR